MIGALLHSLNKFVTKIYFPLAFFFIGLTFHLFSKEILIGVEAFINLFYNHNIELFRLNWLYERLGMVFMELSILMLIDKFLGHKIKDNSLFLKIGQNTLTIYIIHMMILYGSVIGFGVNKLFHKGLTPIEVTIGASLFILFFVILIKYLDYIKEKLSFVLNPIKRFFNTLFRIN